MLASILIPVGPYHRDIAQRAMDSAYRQTIPCAVHTLTDNEGRGAGWCRNQLASTVDSLFIVFLDADDELLPDFVETCVKAYKPGRYVYSDWLENNIPQQSPDCDAWVNTAVRPHLVTTLLPTVAFEQTGGFDEQLPGFEDGDFYLKLRAYGWCGTRVPKPLLHYHGDGQRSEAFKQNPQRVAIRSNVMMRYKEMIMAGCCGAGDPPVVDAGERQLGDVLAQALYTPSTQFGAPLNGQRRFYKRTYYQGQEIWIAPHDARAFPNLWRIIRDPAAESPDVDTVMALARAAFQK